MSEKSVFLHDGSFPGFLCAAAELINSSAGSRDSGSRELLVVGPGRAAGLFETVIPVERDDRRARGLWDRFSRRIGTEPLRSVLEAFLSDHENADGTAAAVLVRLWNEGKSVLDDLTDPNVAAVEGAARRTAGEAHRFLGLVRFSELADGTYYAPITPDCDVLRLIAEHFSARFPGMSWVIHDVRRGSAVLHGVGKPWILVEDLSVARLEHSPLETRFREAWKRYFAAIAIEGRKNAALQASFLPKKHWANLPEMEPPAANLDPFRPICILESTPHD
jgi:probable DNA metabolism protein